MSTRHPLDVIALSTGDRILVDRAEYGGKAHWLSWLARSGFEIPYTVLLPAQDPDTDSAQDLEQRVEQAIERLRLASVYRLAVRSSATCEDDIARSFAGQFKTVLGTMTLDDLYENIAAVRAGAVNAPAELACRMGVIVQQLIEPRVSGVAFSSNPLTRARRECVLSVTEGFGEELVSGRRAGQDLVVAVTDDGVPVEHVPVAGIVDAQVANLCQLAKEIERLLDRPIDLEWCVEHSTGKLVLLQCRPATGFFTDGPSVIPVTRESTALFPARVAAHSKVKMRLDAQAHEVAVSPAHVVVLDFDQGGEYQLALSTIGIEPRTAALSVVLVEPRRLDSKVVRTFASPANLREAIADIAALVARQYWAGAVIVQQVYDATFTGIIQRTPDGWLAEVARGHFVPKGVVSTSTYFITKAGGVGARSQVPQEKAFRIFGGEVVEERLDANPPKAPPWLDELPDAFAGFGGNGNLLIEFGVIEDGGGEPLIYLIDVAQAGGNPPDPELAFTGVISPGAVTGRTVEVKVGAAAESVDKHLGDQVALEEGDSTEATVFLCDRPDMSLAPLLQTARPGALGFAFREGSVLCHLALLLREHGIPAVELGPAFDGVPRDAIVHLDAAAADVENGKRVTSA